ncbi:MAG: GNAT family N-acetyltransferase [Sandaracinus sp.]
MPFRIERFDEGPLRLRSYERGDLDRLSSLLTDPVTMGPVGGPLRRDEVLGMLERYLAPEDPRYLVVVAAFEGETYVGSGRVFVSDFAPGSPEIGYLVASGAWGRGHGTHLARALLGIGHGVLAAPRIVARTHVSNVASARVLEKVGMAPEGRDGDLVRFVSNREKMTLVGT